MSGVKPSSVDPSLPDNTAELEAAKDAAKETPEESAENDEKARSDAKAVSDSILNKDKS